MYYAVASGAGPLQRVLGRSLRDRETVIARRSIEALSRSTGGAGLWAGLVDERPLVDALSYGDRRVEYDAALALGRANPREAFAGADRVVPTLAGLVRDAGSRFALVVADDPERQQSLRSALSGAGYTVLAPARSLSAASGAIAQAPGIDLVVMELPTARTLESIQEIRRTTRLVATPVLALLPVGDVTNYRSQLSDDHLTRLVRTGVNADQIAESAAQLASAAGGEPLAEEEAERYASDALDVLHTIAISGNETLSVRDAAGALVSALAETEGEIRAKVADVLSAVGSTRAQQAMFDAAVVASDAERVTLLTATANSAKRFGNLLDPAQVRRLISMVTESEGAEATAAAALMGALNLPNDQLVPLILRGE
jgi:CheY-like chemotaxis protein